MRIVALSASIPDATFQLRLSHFKSSADGGHEEPLRNPAKQRNRHCTPARRNPGLARRNTASRRRCHARYCAPGKVLAVVSTEPMAPRPQPNGSQKFQLLGGNEV